MPQEKHRKYGLVILLLCVPLLLGCSTDQTERSTADESEMSSQAEPSSVATDEPQEDSQAEPSPVATDSPQESDPLSPAEDSLEADVLSVEVSGSPNDYRFSVEIESPDEGCDQYADWWEVLTEDGELLYRRILVHSHVNEQPFVRSGGPVDLAPDAVVVVRAHMHPGGYGGRVMQGTAQSGFEEAELAPGFAADVERESPQPSGCQF